MADILLECIGSTETHNNRQVRLFSTPTVEYTPPNVKPRVQREHTPPERSRRTFQAPPHPALAVRRELRLRAHTT